MHIFMFAAKYLIPILLLLHYNPNESTFFFKKKEHPNPSIYDTLQN